jgi:hypothetical protein
MSSLRQTLNQMNQQEQRRGEEDSRSGVVQHDAGSTLTFSCTTQMGQGLTTSKPGVRR